VIKYEVKFSQYFADYQVESRHQSQSLAFNFDFSTMKKERFPTIVVVRNLFMPMMDDEKKSKQFP
jgi:hypothetical protein